MKKGIVLACMLGVASIGFCGWLYADIIKFKDGSLVVGKVIAETDDIVMIQAGEGVKKIYRKDIQEITKGDHREIGAETATGGFSVSNISQASIADLESTIEVWLQKLRPLQLKGRNGLTEALTDLGLNNRKSLFSWLSKWGRNGFSWMSLGDTKEVIRILEATRKLLEDDMRKANAAKECPVCHGNNRTKCPKCHGVGKIAYGKELSYSMGKSGIAAKKMGKSIKCPECRGSGRVSCNFSVSKNEESFHVAEKRIKRVGGKRKAAKLLSMASEHASRLHKIIDEVSKAKNVPALESLAETLHRKKYHYMALEILKRIER